MSSRTHGTTAVWSLMARVSRRQALWALAAMATVLVVWLALRPGVVTAPTGVRLGHVSSGVHPSELNVLLVTLDTTRADRLGAYGFTGAATPNLDRIAREGVLFEHAVSPAPLTLPVHS